MPDDVVVHATTIVAICYTDGVVMAGDRRATEGTSIADRAIEKVFPADRHSAVSIAGAAGPAIEMVRIFQTELEHYEKVEGMALSLEGKANKLGGMVRANLPMAMQGLAVMPIYAGYDLRRRMGRIFKYDLTGGRYEDHDFHATGSGGRDARTTIKLGYKRGMDRAQAIELAIESPLPGVRRGLRHRRSRHGPGHLPHHGHHHRRRLRAGRRRRGAERFTSLLDRKTAEGYQP